MCMVPSGTVKVQDAGCVSQSEHRKVDIMTRQTIETLKDISLCAGIAVGLALSLVQWWST